MTAVAVVEQSIASFALHALWQIPLLVSAAGCAIRAGRPQARVAHLLWVATLVLCVMLPLGSTVMARRAALAAEHKAQVSFSYETLSLQDDLKPMQRQPAWKRLLHRHLNSRDGLQPFTVSIPQRWSRVITCVWLLLLSFFTAQLCIGWIRVRALVRAATGGPLPHAIQNALQQQCDALHMQAPDAKLHGGIAGPLLAGVVQPTLLLPSMYASDMCDAEIKAVLAHELAHLRRCDPLVHAACSLLLLPVCFHPAAVWAARCVRQTREMACDAEAAERMGSTADYAWALLKVAERLNAESRHAAATGLFSNGLFGAGLQLFTNGGAMEERMQMLMNGNQSKVQGRAARVAVGVSLAMLALAAATTLQIQPTLAAERSMPQAAVTSATSLLSKPAAQESDPALIGGDHAREQLRRAHRQLTQAESQATSAEDREKIEGAKAAVAAAEQALDAADSTSRPRLHLHQSELNQLNLQPKDMKLPDPAALQAQMERQLEAMTILQAQFNAPEWKARMEAMAKLQEQFRSPEFHAQLDAASRVDQAKINALMAHARAQQQKAMEQIRSGAIQRQIDAAPLLARVEPSPIPAPFASSPADQQSADKPLKIGPGAIAGNKTGGANPVYPSGAKEKRIMGTVVLHTIIDKTGKVEAVQVVSSPDDSLSRSAVAAVQTWVYRPYLLNGQPIAVDTTVNVNFSLVQ